MKTENQRPESRPEGAAREVVNFEEILRQDDIRRAVKELCQDALRNHPNGIMIEFDDPKRARALQEWLLSLRPRSMPANLKPVRTDEGIEIRELSV